MFSIRNCMPSCPHFLNFQSSALIRIGACVIPRKICDQTRQFSKTSVISKGILRELQKNLDCRVIGQPHATKAIVDALHLHAAGLGDPRLPIANLLFLGPTGVGKTELAKVLAEILYGSRNALLQFDMPKYTHAANVSALVGTTQGFVGYQDGGLLTQPIIENTDRVVLFDELEKTHSSMYKVLLSVMGSGEIADNRGKLAFFNRSMIILTSNLDSLKIQDLFKKNCSPEEIEEKLRPGFMEYFSPEFYGRITPILFRPADAIHLKQVSDKMLNEVKERVEGKAGIYLIIDDNVKKYIEKEGFSFELGFRPTARFIEQKIVLPIAKFINEEKVARGDILHVKYEGKEIYLILENPKNKELNQSRMIRNLMAKNNVTEAIHLYTSYSQNIFAIPIWPKEFVDLSLEIGKKCLEPNKDLQSLSQAHRIFTDLAAKGNVEAKAYLGNLYLEGKGAPKNESMALKLFMEAAEFGNPLANFGLGKMYLKGLGGLDCNPYLAEQYFDKAIANGTGSIINNVGTIFASDPKLFTDKQKIIDCYKRAAALGNPWAYYNLAKKHLTTDVDGKVSVPKAIDYLLKAGSRGVKEAYSELAGIYRGMGGSYFINEKLAEKYEALSKL